MKAAKRFCSILIFLLLAALGFARDVEERNLENMHSWKEPFDISNKKGKYNVVVTAKDKGGNTTIGGPLNIFIDPKSDLPITDITNPRQGMSVSNYLDIVGICNDDDGVAYVELILDGDKEHPVRAKGKNFWSYFVDTSTLEEGTHTIEAYGVDINGLKGNSVKTSWYLDRHLPKATINNYTMGTLVSGKVKFEGVVSDGSGIKSLEYTTDGGASFEAVKFSKNKKSFDANFSFSLDTKKMDDGPGVLWLLARDGQDSISFLPFLLFVDNGKPEVEIAYPAEKQKVTGGAFTVAGSAYDAIGLKSLKWSYGSQHGEFEIIPGNIYWIKEFSDLKNIKNGKFVITAEDAAGNIKKVERSIVVDSKVGKPVVTIDWPKAGASFAATENIFVRGIAVDDDNVAKVKIFVDGSQIATVDTAGVFCQSIVQSKPLGSGKHTISVSAVDNSGVEGQKTSVAITVVGDIPYFGNTKIVGGKAAGDLPYGKTIQPEKGGNIEIECGASAGIEEAWCIVAKAGMPESGERIDLAVKKGEKKKKFSIPVNALPFGVVDLTYHIIDKLGLSTEYNTCVYVQNSSETLETTEQNDKKGIYWVPTDVSYYSKELGAYVLPQQTFAAYVNAVAPINATVLGGDERLKVTVDGNAVYIECSVPGTYKGIQIKATDAEGQTYTSQPVTFIAAEEGCYFEIASPLPNDWAKNSVKIQGSAVDKIGISSIEYSVDNGETWKAVPFRAGGTNIPFAFDVNISDFAEGIVPIDLRAKNSSGQDSYYHTAVFKDVTPPEIQIVVPFADSVINGQNTIAMLVKDNGIVEKVEYVSGGGSAKRIPLELTSMPNIVLGTPEYALNSSITFVATDAAGNETRLPKLPFVIDNKSDLPVVQIHLPIELQTITEDFKISGIVTDDDGPCTVYYKIDNNQYVKFSEEPGYSFDIDVPISSVSDNEHIITMYAVDVNGVRGKETISRFHVSLEEPKCSMTAPDIVTMQKGIVTLRGTASDKNGIASVEVSVDNGSSYNMVEGTTNWSYSFDSRSLPDGTHVVFIRTTDKYDVQSLYSTQITLDNTSPEINLELPLDNSQTSGNLFFSGFVLDNIELKELYITLFSLDGRAVPAQLRRINLEPQTTIAQVVDLNSLENGNYNVTVSGVDAAGNITSSSRNIKLDKTVAAASVDICYPLNGERKQGAFTIMGVVRAERNVKEISLLVDGKKVDTTELKPTKYYKFQIEQEQFEDGVHTYMVQALLENGATINSMQQTFNYSAYGPWVRIDNFDYGDFATDRPMIKGSAGYSLNELEVEVSKMKGATKEQKADIAMRSIKYIELSWDNGRTFKQVSKKDKWNCRVETDDLEDGYHFLLVCAVMKNGEMAITRCVVQIDKVAPFVRIIAPGSGGHYNQSLEFSGFANDNVGLDDVKIALRKGDKNSYGIPKIVQGLYFDASFWGATLYDIGVGLTLFDDNVRLQLSFGQFTQEQRNIFRQARMRYGGDKIFGLKIIANVANVDFGRFFGHDWDWLSASFAVGASFKYFSESSAGTGQILSAIIGQIEFPRAHFRNWKKFSTMSLYSEFQLWFIPSDVANVDSIQSVKMQTSFGARVHVF